MCNFLHLIVLNFMEQLLGVSSIRKNQFFKNKFKNKQIIGPHELSIYFKLLKIHHCNEFHF